MAALTAPRNTLQRVGDVTAYPVAADTVIHQGGLVVLAAGYAAPGSTATGLVAVGRAESSVNNAGGAAGAQQVEARVGVFRFANSVADPIAAADRGSACYIVDDQTVAKTSGSGTRSLAGTVYGVDADGVWVGVGSVQHALASGSLLAANNLGDLASAAAARTALGGGADKVVLNLGEINLVGATAAVKRIASPVAGDIVAIHTVLNGALAAGNATLTAKIGAAAVTDGVVTIAQSGSAAGDVDATAPSAANTVAVGSVISLTAGGTNTADVTASVIVVITPSA